MRQTSSAIQRMISAQERAIVEEVRAIRVSNKPEVIGSLFEDTFRAFLSRVSPATVAIVPGFIVDEDGHESTHFDAIAVDTTFPYLSSIGPHRYVMSRSVVWVMELTTGLNLSKLRSIFAKAAEVEAINLKLYEPMSNEVSMFYAVAVDSKLPQARLRREYSENKPNVCHLYTLCPPAGSEYALHAWMEDGRDGVATVRPTISPLADLVSMISQMSLYTLSPRMRDPELIGQVVNHYIRWGSVDGAW